jgi:hypothetical protein
MTPAQQAWTTAQQMWAAVADIDPSRLTPGLAERLADQLQSFAVQLKPVFRQYNLVSDVEAVETTLKELRRSRREKSGAVARVQNSVYGVYMRAHSLAHPPSNSE